MANLVAGKIGLVTGGGSGIGRAICQTLARNGASVVVVDVQKDGAQETVELLKKESPQGTFTSFVGDVSKREQVESLKDFFVQQFNGNPANFLVNSAGITRDGFLVKMNDQMFEDVINVNLKAIYMLNQTFAKLAIEKEKPASFVNLSSIVGKTGNIGQTNYAASKAGVIGFTKSAARELARYNIRVNSILPGFVKTPMTQKVPDKVLNAICQKIPIGRMGNPEEIAHVVTFLCSDLSSYVTGAQIEVTGGLDM